LPFSSGGSLASGDWKEIVAIDSYAFRAGGNKPVRSEMVLMLGEKSLRIRDD
jgi:hypothetical protein